MNHRRSARAARPIRVVAAIALSVMVLAACSGDDPEPDAAAAEDDASESDASEGDVELPTVVVLSGSNPPVTVGIAEGFYEEEGVEVVHNEVGQADEASLFIGGNDPIGQFGPWQAASFRAEGEDLRWLTTAGSTNMINGVVVRSEDADTFQDVSDLEGLTVGNPGFGSATWGAFEVMVDEIYGLDATTDFDNVTADPGALLGLLSGGEIDAALLFSGQTATALALEEFELIFSFTDAWQEETGQPLAVVGLTARGEWVDENPEQVAAVIRGTERAVAWMRDNPDEFRPGGTYEQLAEDQGWLRSEEATDTILDLLAAGDWYLSGELYTDEWIDAVSRFIAGGEGTLLDDVGDLDQLFYPPLE